MPQALLVAIGVLFVAAFFFVIRRVGNKQNRQAEASIASWQEAKQVGELINLYLNMALKHGPGSPEANAFRFGVENSELWGGEKNSEALKTFTQIVERFDSALVRNRKMFRWSK